MNTRSTVSAAFATLAVGALLTVVVAGTAPPPSEDAVKAMIGTGKFDEAVAGARERIAASPNDAQGYVLVANALLRKAQSKAGSAPGGGLAPISAADAAAIGKEIEKAIHFAPERKDLYLGLVELASDAGQDDAMVAQVGRAAKGFPGDVKMLTGLLGFASDDMQAGRSPRAGRILETLVEQYPKQPTAILALTSWLISRGQLDRATKVVQDGLKNLPGNATLHEALGDTSSYRLDFHSAVRSYAKATSLDPKRRSARLSYAAALHITDPREARTIAAALRDEGGPESAVPTLEVSPDGNPRSSTKISRAAAALVKSIDERSPEPLADFGLAKSLWQQGLGPQALAETEVALTKDPAQMEAWMLRASIFGGIGLDAQALEALDKAQAILDAVRDRSFAYSRDEVLAARGASLSRLGRNEEALAAFGKVSDPDRFAYSIGIVQEKLGHVEEARRLLEKVVASGSNSTEVEAARRRLAQEPYRKNP